MRIEKKRLVSDLIALGVKSGDVVFICADLFNVGYFSQDRVSTLEDWIEILLSVVGDSGTIVIPAYTRTFFRFKKNRDIVFCESTPPTSGALSMAFYNFRGVVRSRHPTNSCFAIGKHASEILKDHDEHSTSYLPYERLVDLGGKNLMIGSLADKRLAPMTIHLAQERLGLTRKNWAAGLLQCYYLNKSGETVLFTRRDVGGCTAGGYKSLGHHIISDAISIGKIGNAWSGYIDCRKSYEIMFNLLRENPKVLSCDDEYCPHCRGSPMIFHPVFWARFFYRYVSRL
jgi:aminoglycoside 3-N-acetyltransferase